MFNSPPPTIPPAPPALKEIGHARSSAFCSTLKKQIVVSLASLQANDTLIDTQSVSLAKLGHYEKRDASIRADFEANRLYGLQDSLIHNLALIDRLLADSTNFPPSPQTTDQRDLNALKQHLLDVANIQKQALNVVSGALATRDMAFLQQHGDDLASVTGPEINSHAGLAPTPPPNPLKAGLQSTGDDTSYLVYPDDFSGSYAPHVRILADDQRRIATSETIANDAIMADVARCTNP